MDPEATGSCGVFSINRMALSPMKTMTHLPISAWIFFFLCIMATHVIL